MKTLFLQPQMRIFMHMKMKAIFLLIISFSAISCGDTDNPGNDDSLVITTDDRFVDCVGYTGVEETLEVTTWNIERFPLNENLTPAAVMGTITGSNIDLWALHLSPKIRENTKQICEQPCQYFCICQNLKL